MTLFTRMRTQVSLAALAGLGLRIFFVLRFPVQDSGDAPFYIELAWNWLKNGVFGFPVNNQLTPVDARAPGYPAFLAAIFAFAGKSTHAVMLVQAVVDLGTCFLIALIAARLAPQSSRRRVVLAGLWLAALCPFTANYTAVVLTETLVTFLTALAILVLLGTHLGIGNAEPPAPATERPLSLYFLGGIVVGFGALVRPETPLLLAAAGIVLAMKWWQPSDWLKLARAGVLMGIGLVLPLLPWGARNWRTLHEVQFLASRHSQLPGEYTPLGFDAWTKTWLWRFGDVYLTLWKEDVEEISLDDLPPSAFDSADERARVANLLEKHNEELTMGPALDAEFAKIARERTRRHPLRTYVRIPFLRGLALWFTPRVELLPFGGHLWPLGTEWKDDRQDFVVTLSLVLVNCFYIGLAIGGAWISRRRPGWMFLVLFVVLRTVFFTSIETPEPRYVLECFPAVMALAAQTLSWGAAAHLSSKGSG